MRLSKDQALAHWQALPDDAPIRPASIAYRSRGSTYGLDGIRVEGSREFIDAVLGRLKPLLAAEGPATRLGLNYQQVEARPGKAHNGGEWVCYVKVHERGPEARILAAKLANLRSRRR